MSFEYNDETFKKIQNVELEMLKEVDRICRKYDRPLCRTGCRFGRMGSGRTGADTSRGDSDAEDAGCRGFIPWDDDIDIRMLRKDYDKFCDVCQNEFGEKYFWQTYHTDPGYRWEYGRVLKNNTKFFRSDHEMIKSKNGIFLDIFPCDNMPEKGLSKLIFNLRSFIARKIGFAF